MTNIIKYYNTTNVFFFSDLHIGHERDFILHPRGFKTAKESEDTLINNWNSVVNDNAVCFLLGDSVVGAGENSKQKFVDILAKLNYRELYIMPGNHFAGYKQFLNYHIHDGCGELLRFEYDFNGKTVYLIPNYYELVVKNQFFVLSHYPILSYNNSGKGAIHLFGHVHGNLNKTELGRLYLSGRVLDVSPESIGNYPISYSKIMEIMKERKPLELDHH